MVFTKYNSLKSDIRFNPIFRIQVFEGHGFRGPRFFWVQNFLDTDFSGSGSRVQVHVLEVAVVSKNIPAN